MTAELSTTEPRERTRSDRSGRAEPAPRSVGEALQPVVADLVALGLHGKNAHWNVSGPGFRSVHLALDDVVASAQSAADAIAERARALGLAVDGSPAAVAAAAYAPALPVPTTVAQTVRWATARIEAVTAGVRAAVEEVAEVDPPTGDLLNAIVLDLDKQRWLLRSEASDPAT